MLLGKKLKVGRCSKCWDYGHNTFVTTVENRGMTDTHALMRNFVLYVIQKGIEQAQADVTY